MPVAKVRQPVAEPKANKAEEVKEEPQVSPEPVTAEEPVLTRDELTVKLEQLSERARAAGMSPIQAMLASYAQRGMKIVDGFLGALEDDGKKPEKPVEGPPTTKKQS